MTNTIKIDDVGNLVLNSLGQFDILTGNDSTIQQVTNLLLLFKNEAPYDQNRGVFNRLQLGLPFSKTQLAETIKSQLLTLDNVSVVVVNDIRITQEEEIRIDTTITFSDGTSTGVSV